MKLKIKVKNEHINYGVHSSSRWCPVALAMKDAGCKKVRVGADIRWKYKGVKYQVKRKGKVDRFILDFDSCYDVNPFSFRLTCKG